MGATLLALGLSCSSDPGPTWSSCAGRVDAGRDPGHPAEPSAIDALDRVAKAHVDAWRAANNMQEESDFAFAFSTFEGAQTAGGHHLAAAWIAARAAQTSDLMHAAASVIESSPPRRRRDHVAAVRAPVRSWAVSKRRGLRLQPNNQESPEALTRKAEVLGETLQRFGALRPHGFLSKELEAEWGQSCLRLGQRLVTGSEPVTVSNALKTSSELEAFMASRSRPWPPSHVDLDSFLHSKSGTPAPCRALNSLRWWCKQGQLSWELSQLTAPTARSRKTSKQQAIVVEPPMIPYLEEKIERLHATGEERWSALLGSWITAFGVLRYRHIARSSPRRLTKSTLHCRCSKGKQRRLREGFAFCIPAVFSTGWPWAQHLLTAYDKLPPALRATAGLCFDRTGCAWPLQEVTLITREVFVGQIEQPDTLTSYSWRRLASTVGHMLNWQPTQLASLGDWQNKRDMPEEAAMPLHYSGARYQQSLRSKHLVLASFSILSRFESWDLVSQEALDQIKTLSPGFTDKAVNQDSSMLWAVPPSPEELRSRFNLTTALKSRAAQARKQHEDSHTVKTMPSAIQGRTMSAFMKNGTPLCSAFQSGVCGRSEDECRGAHRCAAVLRSGRVCGGRHPGCECRDKRVVLVNPAPTTPQPITEPPVPPLPVRSPDLRRPSEPAHPPSKRSRKNEEASSSSQPAAPTPVIQVEIEDDEVAEAKYDRWATGKGKTAQEPSKIWRSQQGGTLWLGGLPVASTAHKFPAATLQVCCFSKPVKAKGGVQLPNSKMITIAPSTKRSREAEWRVGWPLIKQTLFAAEDVYVHCMAGRHRGGGIAVLCRALLANESLEEAETAIAKVRDIDLRGLWQDHTIAEWMASMKRTSMVGQPLPPITGFMATARSHTHLMVTGGVPLCHHKQQAEKATDRLTQPLTTTDEWEAAAWSRPLCQACLGRAPASVQLRLEKFR